MKLQTEIPLKKQESSLLIDYHSNVLLLGSCFAEHLGEKLQYHKLQSLCNPFGILFHPLAIRNLVLNSVNQKVFSEEDIFLHNEQWHSFDVHSKLSSPSKDELLENLNKLNQLTFEQIKISSHVVITLGTAWVYRFLKTSNIVANCHKISQKEFSKELLSAKEIFNALDEIVSLINQVNSDCKILFTLSPVRHIKDGFVENTRSKAHLISTIHHILESKDNCYYFPSYEIVMDELRDYRFYNEDMLHPNTVAIDHIWEKFQKVWFGEEAITLSKRIEAIQKSMSHKPFNSKSEGHQRFLKKLEKEKMDISNTFPHIVF